ncbi:terminase [Caballeronia sp. NCTM1]|uniref:terminase n=1 Tax=Caballeronia sp. NCTM1 TaxID=2921753 RepID=UPI0020292B59|nr:terminase [Caballeronia sp. NCTM1]
MARPSNYKAEYAEQARKLCLLGATDKELADFFEVSEQTINAWKNAHKEFLESIKRGKMQADSDVADRLYQRAMGYEHPEIDLRVVGGEIVETPITKIYAPDTTAAIFWLKNRQRGKWRDKVDQEITGADGGPVAFTKIERTIVRPPDSDT